MRAAVPLTCLLATAAADSVAPSPSPTTPPPAWQAHFTKTDGICGVSQIFADFINGVEYAGIDWTTTLDDHEYCTRPFMRLSADRHNTFHHHHDNTGHGHDSYSTLITAAPTGTPTAAPTGAPITGDQAAAAAGSGSNRRLHVAHAGDDASDDDDDHAHTLSDHVHDIGELTGRVTVPFPHGDIDEVYKYGCSPYSAAPTPPQATNVAKTAYNAAKTAYDTAVATAVAGEDVSDSDQATWEAALNAWKDASEPYDTHQARQCIDGCTKEGAGCCAELCDKDDNCGGFTFLAGGPTEETEVCFFIDKSSATSCGRSDKTTLDLLNPADATVNGTCYAKDHDDHDDDDDDDAALIVGLSVLGGVAVILGAFGIYKVCKKDSGDGGGGFGSGEAVQGIKFGGDGV